MAFTCCASWSLFDFFRAALVAFSTSSWSSIEACASSEERDLVEAAIFVSGFMYHPSGYVTESQEKVRDAGGAIAEVLVKARGDVRWDGTSSLKFQWLDRRAEADQHHSYEPTISFRSFTNYGIS
jgi:hypothetical protein